MRIKISIVVKSSHAKEKSIMRKKVKHWKVARKVFWDTFNHWEFKDKNAIAYVISRDRQEINTLGNEWQICLYWSPMKNEKKCMWLESYEEWKKRVCEYSLVVKRKFRASKLYGRSYESWLT